MRDVHTKSGTGGPYSLYVHMDLADDLVGRSELKRRCNMRLRDMTTRGTVTKVKGISGHTNRGWLRTPVGGNGGNQFYLFWTRTGFPPVPAEVSHETHPDAFWVRAVRHHDDNTPLEFGDVSADYYPFSPKDITEDNFFTESPWTYEQDLCARDASSVNILYGRPGSGKTMTLLRIAEDSVGETVMLTTWSRELIRLARAYILTMASPSTRLLAYDFPGLLSAINQYDVKRYGFLESQRRFVSLLSESTRHSSAYGPWLNSQDALYAEVRSVLLGRASPDASDSISLPNGMVRLSDKSYMSLRGSSSGVGAAAASQLLNLVGPLCERPDLPALFPELHAAVLAIEKLRSGNLPEGMSGLHKVLVDEVQDLTLLESTVLVELVLLVRKLSFTTPAIFFAGDEGQTVRPSGFNWNWLKRLLYKRIGIPLEFEHSAQLRTSQRISSVVDNTTSLYRAVERGERPSNQRSSGMTSDNVGRVCYARVKSTNEAIEVLTDLLNKTSVQVMMASDDIPEWLPDGLSEFVLTPAMAKGLEYEQVCIINPGSILSSVSRNAHPELGNAILTGNINRTIIDNLRVAISRATDVLVFLDVDPDEKSVELSLELLGENAVEIEVGSLMSDVLVEIPSETRIQFRLDQARILMDSDRKAAWEHLIRARYLCDEKHVDLIRRIHFVTLSVAAQLVTEGVPEGIFLDSVIDVVRKSVSDLGVPEYGQVFSELVSWSSVPTASPIPLLQSVSESELDMSWIKPALESVSQSLINGIERMSGIPDAAPAFIGSVPLWLEIVGFEGQAYEKADALRMTASCALFEDGQYDFAYQVLQEVPQDIIVAAAEEGHRNAAYLKSIFLYDFLGLDRQASFVRALTYKSLMEDALLYHRVKNYDFALDLCEQAIKLLPGNIPALELHALILHDLERYEDSLKDFDLVIDFTDDEAKKLLMLKNKVDALWLINRPPQHFIDCYDEILDIDPMDIEVRQDRIAMRMRHTNDFDKGIEECEELISMFPLKPAGYAEGSAIYRLLGEWEKALAIIDRGLSRVIDDAMLVAIRGAILSDMSAPGLAIDFLVAHTDAHPEFAPLHSSLGRAYIYDNQPLKAIGCYRNVIRLEPHSPENYQALAMALFDCYIKYNRDVKYVSESIIVLTEGLNYIGKADPELVASMYGFRGTSYNERSLQGDQERRDADFRAADKVVPGFLDSTGRKIIKSAEAAFAVKVGVDPALQKFMSNMLSSYL